MDKPTISELAHALKLDRSTLGRNLKVLEREKLIGFSGGKDERSKHVVLTPAGKSVLIIATPLWQAAQQKFLLSLGDDAGLLVKILAKIDRDAGDEKRNKSGRIINGD
ncbi:MAG: winged helix-turn-helix transcriptional regulator, partial [Proteobacteria bacterium]|nr:winged helix-turn-helix transcriptional regulator [Pseudomonadota bacterium]